MKKQIKVFLLIITVIISSCESSYNEFMNKSSNLNSTYFEKKFRKFETRDTRSRSSSLYYSKPFIMDNNITGTGFKLKDLAYKSACALLDCSSGCCEGPIVGIYCGIPENCAKYLAHVNFWQAFTIILIILSVIVGLIFGFFMKKNQVSKSVGIKPNIKVFKVENT